MRKSVRGALAQIRYGQLVPAAEDHVAVLISRPDCADFMTRFVKADVARLRDALAERARPRYGHAAPALAPTGTEERPMLHGCNPNPAVAGSSLDRPPWAMS
jgi:hypothetical protein